MTQHDPIAMPLSDLATELGLAFVQLRELKIDPALFAYLPVDVADRLDSVPLRLDGEHLVVAMSEPLNLELQRKLGLAASKPVRIVVAERDEIRAALKRSESSGQVLNNVSGEFRAQIVKDDGEGGEHVVNLDTIQGQRGVVLLANSILMAALQKQASDIHVEVYSKHVDVKYRIDGVLYPATEALDYAHHAGLISRFKVMADLDITERRIPQDGRFKLRMEERDIDFRVSVLPTQYGEDIVIRILDKAAVANLGARISLADLGLDGEDIKRLRMAVRQPYGLVLVTGPTGSGKTTTLYGTLSELSDGTEKIITIEDPVEYELDGIVQIAVNERKGLTFASGLRSILRHDPDRILVGEIRDLETAEIAVQAALTGHLVLASVHANNAIDVISRFTHWKLDLHDFVAALNTVVAQRLLRRLCPSCKAPANYSAEEMTRMGVSPTATDASQWYRAVGCSHCRGTGYAGRTAILEHLTLTPEVSDLFLQRAPTKALANAARSAGMVGLRDKALGLAAKGETSLEEVNRVVMTEAGE